LALVTGAAQGIGQALALALAERGAEVIVTDLTLPQQTVNKIGPTGHPFQLDVTQEEDWRSLSLKSRDVDAKEKVGPLRRNIFKHGRLGDNRNEPLHRFKDGNYWFHERFSE
jgi:short chain dehydrogenase